MRSWAGVAIVGGLAHMAICKLKDFVLGVPLIQDGSRCPTCGYIVLHLPEPRCPECGRAFDQADLGPASRRSVFRRVLRSSLVAMLIGLAMFESHPYIAIFGLARSSILTKRLPPPLRVDVDGYERALLTCARFADQRTRLFAIDCLGLMPWTSDRAMQRLQDVALGDPDPTIRASAVSSLGSRRAADFLRLRLPEFLGNPNGTLRMATISALGMSGSDALDPLAEQIMADPDPQVRRLALSWIAHGNPRTLRHRLQVLIRALDDPDPSVRHKSLGWLKQTTGESFPFNAQHPREQRQIDQARWQAWLDAQPELEP